MDVESLVQKSSLLDGENEITRQIADYPPCVWGDYFIKHQPPLSSSTVQKTENWIRERVEELVIQVKNLLEDCGDDLKRLEIIDDLQRLGIGYHFEEEIDSSLKRIHDGDGNIDGNNLHGVALKFRLLRQHGYYVKSDAFGKFKGDGGEFKRHFADDARSLLSLYEACFLATPEEEILDEALIFAKHYLRSLLEGSGLLDSFMKALVSHALELPLHKRISRLEARYFMEMYEEGEESQNSIILELAKLDFHLLQLLHYQEVQGLSIWWEGILQTKKFNFTRDRIVECYFWIITLCFEPQFSVVRKISAKVMALLSITDDVYDTYGTLNELQSFTEVIKRWDVEAVDHLEEYMQILFQNFFKTFQDFENELAIDGKSYRMHYLKDLLKIVTENYLEEAKWREEGYIPTLKDHLKVSTVTTCFNLLSCASFLGMDSSVTKEVFDWVLTFPKFIYHSSMICRLKDDVTSQEFEQKRFHVASTVQCYMKDHNCTLEKANEELLKMVEDEWKNLNREYLSLSSKFSRNILTIVINLARYMETTYDVRDKFTESNLIKHHISKILVEPVSF